DADIKINLAAQGRILQSELLEWFGQLSGERRIEVLNRVGYFCLQSHPKEDEINAAIERSGLKSGYTPCVLLRKEPFKVAVNKITALPTSEHIKSFLLLISLLGIADARRRKTECLNGCTHE